MNRTYNIAFDKLFHFYNTENLELLPFMSVDLADIVGSSASCLAAITVSELPLGTIKLRHCIVHMDLSLLMLEYIVAVIS